MGRMTPRAPRKRKLSKAGSRRVVSHAARVAADALEAAEGREPPPDPDGDDLDPDEDFGGPPLPIVEAPKAFAPPADEIAELVKRRPSDPLAAQSWMHELMMLQLGKAAIDPEIPDAQRRKESRTIALTADRLVPKARIHQAEQTVLNAQKRIEEKQAARAGARLRPRMTGASVKDPGVEET